MFEQYTNTLNTGAKVTGCCHGHHPYRSPGGPGLQAGRLHSCGQLTDDPTVKPEDVVKVGDEVELFVIRVNDVEGYATLSKKRLDAVKVWENIEEPAARRFWRV